MSQNTKIIQSSLVSGILSEESYGRIDYPKYYNGVAKADNVVVQPTGGMEKRSGFQFISPIDKDYRLIEFIFNTTEKYVVLIGEGDIKIYDIINKTSFMTTVKDDDSVFYSLKQSKELDFVQFGDTMILTHTDIHPQKLVRYRNNDEVTWKLEKINLKNIPQFNWKTNKHDANASRIKKAKSGDNKILDLKEDIMDAISIGEGLSPRVESTKVENSYVTIDGTDSTRTTKTERKEFWYPSGNYSDNKADGDTVLRWGTKVTIDDNNGKTTHSTSVAWDELLSETIQKAISSRVTLKSTQNGAMTADQLKDLIGGDYTAEINIEIDKILGTWDDTDTNISDVWSDEKGYPKYCTFYQNRLFLAASEAKPLSVWASVTNDFFNFDISEADADYAIADTINSNTLNAITGIYPGSVLQVYTTGAEYTNTSTPITPTDSSWRFQTGMGSHDNVPLDSLDGSTIFVDRAGDVRNFVYNFDTDNYVSKNLDLLSKQTVKRPDQVVIIRSSEISISKLVYFRNNDGTLAILNIDKNEDILAWTKWYTNGDIKEIVGVDQSLFVIIERDGLFTFECSDRVEYTYNTPFDQSKAVYLDCFIEKKAVLSPDSNLKQTETVIDGLSIFEGKDVVVMLDNFYMNTFTVKDGSITVPREFAVAQIGFQYTGLIKTLPLSSAQTGTQLNYNRIIKITCNFVNTTAVKIDNQYISDKDFGVYKFGQKPKSISGIKEVYTLGWNRYIQFEVESSLPYPMILLAFTSYLDSNSRV